MKRRIITLLLSTAFLIYAGVTHAITFQLSSINVLLNNTDPGLMLQYNDLAPYTSFDLNNLDDSFSFGLFNLWTNETMVNNDDTVAQPITVTLNFSSPFFSAGPIGGSTVGFSFFGLFQSGLVSWNAPVLANFGDTGQVQVGLSNGAFNAGFGGLNGGAGSGATVGTTIRLTGVDSPGAGSVHAPEPGTLLLLGSGLAGLGLLRRKKLNQANA